MQEGDDWISRALRLAYRGDEMEVFERLVGVMRARDRDEGTAAVTCRAPDWSDAESPEEVARARRSEHLCMSCVCGPVCRLTPDVHGGDDIGVTVSRCAAYRHGPVDGG